MAKPNTLTLVSALDFIAEEINRTDLYSFLETDSKEVKYICDTLVISPLQAALFATILEKSDDDLASTKDMISALGVSKIRFLGFKKEIDGLAKKKLIVVRKREIGSGYRVSHAVVKAIQNNTTIEPEKIKGLSTRDIFRRLCDIFADITNDITSSDIGLQEIIDLMNNNRGNRFVEASIRLGINNLDSKDETLLMFYMLHRNGSFNDNLFSIDEFSNIIGITRSINNPLFDLLPLGESNMQKRGLLDFSCNDGLEDQSRFMIPESVLRDLLADLGTYNVKQKVNIPKDEIISHSDILSKKLFYNNEEGEQIKNLRELLSTEKFSMIQERFREKGLRSGFCCLFYGAAGTGKTETVMQIAKETGRDIFIVDMSRLKSKWVGDSEKNIKQIFNTYKDLTKEYSIAPILLFNEADAIFGRRIKEENATDKMNNAIQNIILQEMETFEGILIATTNLTENFDPAFERRFLYKIFFKTPSTDVKSKIWKAMAEWLSDNEARKLASDFSFTGGQIENIIRKLDVDYILSGTLPDLERIISLCKVENIKKEKFNKKIGF